MPCQKPELYQKSFVQCARISTNHIYVSHTSGPIEGAEKFLCPSERGDAQHLHDPTYEALGRVDVNVVEVNDLIGDAARVADAFLTLAPAALHDGFQERGFTDPTIPLKIEKMSASLSEVLPGLFQETMAPN
jgi:hypothetical protein